MPTHDQTAHFQREFSSLSSEEQRAVMAMVRLFVQGLRERNFDPRLRVKRLQGQEGVWEIAWAPNGRATFEYGTEVRPGEPHIVWRRVGTHAIFREP